MKLLSIDTEKLTAFAKHAGIRFVVLHGSHAIGTAHGESDIDIGIYLEPRRLTKFDFSVHAELSAGLRECLSNAKGEIDLVILNHANILLRYEITSKGGLLYGNEAEYSQYCAFAFREYLDAKPLFDLESDMIRRRQELIYHK